jgi:hypothetical protein
METRLEPLFANFGPYLQSIKIALQPKIATLCRLALFMLRTHAKTFKYFCGQLANLY